MGLCDASDFSNAKKSIDHEDAVMMRFQVDF
jgi:hypothetical protein